jgi:hypothetical protein
MTTLQKPISKAEEKRNKQAKEQLTYSLNKELLNFKEMYLESFVNYRMKEIDSSIVRYQQGGYGYSHLVNKKSRKFTCYLEFLNEGNEGYNIKFERLIENLVEYGIKAYPLQIEKINGGTDFDFGFLISHNNIVVHARFIFACGMINAPHYRFIITKRENKD